MTEWTLGAFWVGMHIVDVPLTVLFSFAQYATQGALELDNHYSFLWEEPLKQGKCAACLCVKKLFAKIKMVAIL